MILLYIGKERFNNSFKSFFKCRGLLAIHYDNPLKAMDNLKEIDPDVVLFNKEDFPRHWKLILKALRENKSREESVFILQCSEDLSEDEQEDAQFFKYNGYYISGNDEKNTLSDLIFKFKIPNISLSKEVFYPESDEIKFAFLNPYNFQFISGFISEIWNKGAFFVPDNINDITEINEGMKFENCSISINGELSEIDCIVESINSGIKLIFITSSEKKITELHALFA